MKRKLYTAGVDILIVYHDGRKCINLGSEYKDPAGLRLQSRYRKLRIINTRRLQVEEIRPSR